MTIKDPVIDVISNGFVRIICKPGPDTLRITVQRPEREIVFALGRDECEDLATILTRFVESRI